MQQVFSQPDSITYGYDLSKKLEVTDFACKSEKTRKQMTWQDPMKVTTDELAAAFTVERLMANILSARDKVILYRRGIASLESKKNPTDFDVARMINLRKLIADYNWSIHNWKLLVTIAPFEHERESSK